MAYMECMGYTSAFTAGVKALVVFRPEEPSAGGFRVRATLHRRGKARNPHPAETYNTCPPCKGAGCHFPAYQTSTIIYPHFGAVRSSLGG